MLLTYPFYVSISSVLKKQPYNISVTIPCGLPEWGVLQNIANKDNKKSIVIYKQHFLFFNDHLKDIWLNLLLRRLHSATNINEI